MTALKLPEPGTWPGWWEGGLTEGEAEKRGLRRNFGRRAATYDRHAIVQRRMGERLLEQVAPVAARAGRILEIGCGTGYLTQLLRRRNPRALMVAVDLDRALLTAARKRLGHDARTVWLMADGETLCRGGFDLVIANAAFQWLAHPRQALANYRRSLRPGGMLAFATLGPGTFWELGESLARAAAQLGTPAPVIAASRFLDVQEWRSCLAATGFRDAAFETTEVVAPYATVTDLLLSLKATGATNPRPRPLSPRLLAAFADIYRTAFGEGSSVPATYDVIWATARK